MKRYIIALALAAGSLAAQATEGAAVYRCGSTYQQTPCAGGKAVDTDDARSSAEVSAARIAAMQTRQQAEAMVRERERLEATIKPALATAIGPAAVAQPVTRPLKAPGKHRFKKKISRSA